MIWANRENLNRHFLRTTPSLWHQSCGVSKLTHFYNPVSKATLPGRLLQQRSQTGFNNKLNKKRCIISSASRGNILQINFRLCQGSILKVLFVPSGLGGTDHRWLCNKEPVCGWNVHRALSVSHLWAEDFSVFCLHFIDHWGKELARTICRALQFSVRFRSAHVGNVPCFPWALSLLMLVVFILFFWLFVL